MEVVAEPLAEVDEIVQLLQRAEQGDAEAQIELGMLYSVGVGVPEDDAESVAWFRRAAEQGDASVLSQWFAK